MAIIKQPDGIAGVEPTETEQHHPSGVWDSAFFLVVGSNINFSMAQNVVKHLSLYIFFFLFRVPKACIEIELHTVQEKLYLHARRHP